MGSVRHSLFGNLPDGTPVQLYTLTNSRGRVLRVTNYGTIITELHVPDRSGRQGDVVLGFDSLAPYLSTHPYFGCTVGRVANRLSNARFMLDGVEYRVTPNVIPHHLHGGARGFDKAVWTAEPSVGGRAAVRFTHRSPAGDEGYPGNLDVTLVLTFKDADALVIDYTAVTDAPTPVNLTNHSYFNLAGAGDILDHVLELKAGAWTPTDDALIPTGEIRGVDGTPLDFRRPTRIGARIEIAGGKPPGYDHNFVIDPSGRAPSIAAVLTHPASGRLMEVVTTSPALQLYTGNGLDGTMAGKGGWRYARHAGLCLETQQFPDAVNQPAFPAVILRPGETWRQTTEYRFSVE